MLRSRSRKVVSSKQGLMATDHSFDPNPTQSPKKPISSFLGSPRIFNGFLGRTQTQSGSENSTNGMSMSMSISPTSILDSKQLLNNNLGHSFGHDRSPNQNPNPDKRPESLGVGLALIDTQSDENKGVLFGSKLKIQIPSWVSPVESPKSPGDFGIKTPRSSPFLTSSVHPKESPPPPPPPPSLSEMELSEDYTCVITHGPNPKTTHIFDNCIVESCCGVTKLKKENVSSDDEGSESPPLSFLRFCRGCNVNLGGGKDIYMYRGERAFCSHECRSQEMVLEGMKKNQEMDDQ